MNLRLLVRASRAEWSRIWSVRSSWWFTAGLAVVVLGIGTLAAIDIGHGVGDPTSTAWDEALFTAVFALFGITAMCVVLACADHTTGGIVPTLQWTPRRGHLLAARTLVVVATTTLMGLLLVVGASVIVRLVASVGLPLARGVEVVGMLALVLACSAGLAVGLGLVTRSTAVALVLAIALLLVLPPVLGNMPWTWAVETAERLPGTSALYLIGGSGPGDTMSAGQARVTLLCWAVGMLAAGGWRLVRSDANR